MGGSIIGSLRGILRVSTVAHMDFHVGLGSVGVGLEVMFPNG